MMAKLLLTLFLFTSCYHSHAQTGTIILNVQGIRVSKGGDISTGIFKKENFPKVGKQFMGKEIEVSSAEMQFVFETVPVGNYAIVAFQDIDRDKKLKSNFLGYPREPIGFSRDAKIRFGPPDFDDAKIEVLENKTLIISITVK